MTAFLGTFWGTMKASRPLALLLYPAAALAVAAVVWATLGAVRGPESAPGKPVAAPPVSAQPAQVEAAGRTVFPVAADLKFETGGTVGEVLAQRGQRVRKGEALARLDAATLAGLKAEAALADVNVTRAREALDTLDDGSPAEVARAGADAARARVALDNARESLDKLVNPEDVAVAAAEDGRGPGQARPEGRGR